MLLNNCTGVSMPSLDVTEARFFLKYTVPIKRTKDRYPNFIVSFDVLDNEPVILLPVINFAFSKKIFKNVAFPIPEK